ncbi:MAG: DUF881 domain-containing protein [Actinomycetaceae bacterium]|nr:DUF881 domain-containing protein [Actinomycetaceae bacterium]
MTETNPVGQQAQAEVTDAPVVASASVSTHQPTGEQNSMSLLSALLYDPLNYGYSATEEQSRPYTLYEKILIFIIAVVLSAGSTVAVKSLISTRTEKETTYQQLLDRVRAEQAKGDQLLAEVKALDAQVKEIAEQEVTFASVPKPLLVSAHAVALKGSGLKIVLQSGNPEIPDGSVQDQDLRLVLNELWRSGAEGIAINGIRIGPRTPVRTAGSSVLVNFQPVAQPYEITVIGNTEALARGVTTGSTGTYFADLYKDFGITLTVTPAEDLVLPALRVPKISIESIQVVKEEDQ